jgi:hypothetical protein
MMMMMMIIISSFPPPWNRRSIQGSHMSGYELFSDEDGSVICSAICQWSDSRRTHNHTLLSHLRLLGSLCVASYDSRDYCGSILPSLTRGRVCNL